MAHKPRWPVEATIRSGIQMLEMLSGHWDRMAEALGPDLRARLEADVDELRNAQMSAYSAQTLARGTTAGQAQLLADAVAQVSAWRTAIRRTCAHDKSVLVRFGVGRKVSSRSRMSVSAALTTMIDAAEALPEQAREAAILPSDVERARATLLRVSEAVEVQEAKRLGSVGSFLRRREIQLRVEQALNRIVAAASMRFIGEPQADEFAALLPRNGRRSRKQEAPEPPSDPAPSPKPEPG